MQFCLLFQFIEISSTLWVLIQAKNINKQRARTSGNLAMSQFSPGSPNLADRVTACPDLGQKVRAGKGPGIGDYPT